MNKKVFINGRFLTGPMTGVQRTAFELAKALDELLAEPASNVKGISFIVIYSGIIKHSVNYKHLTIIKKGLLTGNLWEQIELPFYTFGSLLLNLCSIAPLLKLRQYVMIHDASVLVNKKFFSTAFRLWYAVALPILGKTSKRIITVSNFSKRELIKYAHIKDNKIFIIYNAAEHILNVGNADQNFIDKINLNKPYCLAVSSLGANKNFAGLNKALQGVNFTDFKMLIAGGNIGVLKHVAANDDAVYLGYVTDAELRYLYSNASLFIFPSFYEGFGIPPLEAMILGCPVIASNTSSIPEVLEDACEYFDPNNIENMRQSINNMIYDGDKLSKFKTLGYKQAAKYSWNKSALELMNLISIDCG